MVANNTHGLALDTRLRGEGIDRIVASSHGLGWGLIIAALARDSPSWGSDRADDLLFRVSLGASFQGVGA
jgi:hypothetical protein